MNHPLPTLSSAHKHSACYFGARPNYLIAYSVDRDSDTLYRANFLAFRAALATRFPEGTAWAIERSSHWAVGWIDYLVIDPTNPDVLALADNLLTKLADYPILDEDLYSELEFQLEHALS